MPGPPYQDDPTIADAAELLRRIPPHHFVIDPKRPGGIRAASAAFDDDAAGPMSVYLAEVLTSRGLTYERVLHGHPGYALASFPAKAARECNQVVVRHPGPGDPAHALVCNPKPKGVQRALEKASRWAVAPFVSLESDLAIAVARLSRPEQVQVSSVAERLKSCREALDAVISTNANRRLDRSASSVLLTLESCQCSIISAIQWLRSNDVEKGLQHAREAHGCLRPVCPV